MFKNILVALFFVTIIAGSLQAQQQEKLNALNNYVDFSNEGTHGLLIVHRLLENFNKNINKYVDLPDQQINFYSNKALPQDIFQDYENWFYDTPPNEYFAIISKTSGVLPEPAEKKLKAISGDMKAIMQNINKIRFDLEKMITTLDLTKRENLSTVYDKLEEGVKLFKSYYDKQMVLEREISAVYSSLNIKPENQVYVSVQTALKDVYTSTYTALKAMYNKEDEQYPDLIKAQEAAMTRLNNINLSNLKDTKLLSPKYNNTGQISKSSLGNRSRHRRHLLNQKIYLKNINFMANIIITTIYR
ncbi:MAG: hypothetical protein IPO37_02300 [Saprospiraceae bacterium]|nr:hypothetical protein [Saprospiraceae bacterium]